MKHITRLISILLAIIALFSFTACEARNVKTCQENLDALGFSKLLTQDDFFALARKFTYEGSTAEELMIYEVSDTTQTHKTNENDTLIMTSKTKVETDGKYATTYQQFVTRMALDGLTLPHNITMGTSLADTLEALIGNTKALSTFTASGDYSYEMVLAEKNGARILFRDMTKDESVTGYPYIYQIRFTDETRYMTDTGSVNTKRTLILSFDNEAEGHPLTMIEIVLESRYRA